MTDLHTAARMALEALEDVCERLAFVCGEKDASAPSAVGRAKATALRAALEAQQEPAQPQRWVLVPEGPTPEMLRAGEEHVAIGIEVDHHSRDIAANAYRAMLASRPQPKETT